MHGSYVPIILIRTILILNIKINVLKNIGIQNTWSKNPIIDPHLSLTLFFLIIHLRLIFMTILIFLIFLILLFYMVNQIFMLQKL